jgi:hypothetical protein
MRRKQWILLRLQLREAAILRSGPRWPLLLAIAAALAPETIAAPDATQTPFQGPDREVGGGEQTLDFFFEGQSNALLGTLRGAQLAVDVDFGGAAIRSIS